MQGPELQRPRHPDALTRILPGPWMFNSLSFDFK